MYKTILVRDLVDDGERLLTELDREGFPISAAFWYDLSGSPERPEWKFYIITDMFDRPGLREAYNRINQAMDAAGGLSISSTDILLMSPKNPAFREMRKRIEGVSQMSTTGERVKLEGLARDDTYVYRWSYK